MFARFRNAQQNLFSDNFVSISIFLIFTAIKDVAASLNAKMALYRYGNELETNSSGLKEKDLTSMLAEAPAVPPVIQDKGNYCDKLIYIYTSGTTGLPKAAVITNSR